MSTTSLRDLPLEQLLGKTCVIRDQEYVIVDDLSADILIRNEEWAFLVHVWEYGPGQLWNQLKKLHADRVRAEIETVKANSKVRNKGAYLNKRLSNLCLSAA